MRHESACGTDRVGRIRLVEEHRGAGLRGHDRAATVVGGFEPPRDTHRRFETDSVTEHPEVDPGREHHPRHVGDPGDTFRQHLRDLRDDDATTGMTDEDHRAIQSGNVVGHDRGDVVERHVVGAP